MSTKLVAISVNEQTEWQRGRPITWEKPVDSCANQRMLFSLEAGLLGD